MEALVDAFVGLLSPERIGYLGLGVTTGLIVGMLPGLGGIVGMSLMLPFIYGMDQHAGLALLLGLSAVTTTSDTFASVLLGVPGSAGSQATILDGYPLARQGKAATALAAGFTSSLIGGLLGAVTLAAAIFVARPLILAFRPPELLMLAVLGMSMVAVLGRGAMKYGIMAAALGGLLSTVGPGRTQMTYRYSFDEAYLFDGLPLVVLALGLFAIPELVELLTRNSSIAEKATVVDGSIREGIRQTWQNSALVARSSTMGAVLGMIPGVGGSVIDWIVYGVTARKGSEAGYGSGNIRGVIAPEAANNAKEGGALVPTLMFAVPGSGSMAVLLGGFVLLGVQPGPSMVTGEGLQLTFTIIWTLVVANVLATIVCLGLAKTVAPRITLVPAKWLAPFVLVIIVIASYQATRHWGDIVFLFAIGSLGVVMKNLGWSRPALLIGFVLGPSIERYLSLAISRYGWEWLRWPSIIGLTIVSVLIIVASQTWVRPAKNSAEQVTLKVET